MIEKYDEIYILDGRKRDGPLITVHIKKKKDELICTTNMVQDLASIGLIMNWRMMFPEPVDDKTGTYYTYWIGAI